MTCDLRRIADSPRAIDCNRHPERSRKPTRHLVRRHGRRCGRAGRVDRTSCDPCGPYDRLIAADGHRIVAVSRLFGRTRRAPEPGQSSDRSVRSLERSSRSIHPAVRSSFCAAESPRRRVQRPRATFRVISWPGAVVSGNRRVVWIGIRVVSPRRATPSPPWRAITECTERARPAERADHTIVDPLVQSFPPFPCIPCIESSGSTCTSTPGLRAPAGFAADTRFSL